MEILNEKDYQSAFQKIDSLVVADFESSEAMQKEFLELAKAIQEYEKKHYPLLSHQSEVVIHK
ncbi:hypothetical protein [Dyadobacter crusticola]|uniref:hypothetical protein n=1 Tax=Dyadobacter crusticola TaxID=292407 RepID=UPI0004E1A0CB|nr:hypothetical protein [Dyadobacter crusticola]